MNKYLTYKTLIILIHILFIKCGSNSNEVFEKRNIIFILTDDQTSKTINSLGNKSIFTPNIDRLVKKGTSFTNAYIMGSMNGAVCAPSRAMIITGKSLFNIDPTGNTIDEKILTLPEFLEKRGYHTFHIGKWHNGKKAFSKIFKDGSNIFFGGMDNQYFVPTHEYNLNGIYNDNNLNELSPKHSSTLYTDAAIEFIKNYKKNEPFYLNLSFQAPHDPREMPDSYLKVYNPDSIKLPKNFKEKHPFDNGELDIRDEWLATYPRNQEEIKANIAAYYAMISHMDYEIGRLLDTLEEKNIFKNTYIVFAGDNGLAVGQHGLMGKQNLYEHSINVPLIFTGPNIENSIKKDLVYLFDVFPTIVELLNFKKPDNLDGLSLKDLLLGKEKKIRNSLFFSYKNFQRAARDERWKIIKYNVNNKIETQIFDLINDPFEIKNLYHKKSYDSVSKKMHHLLKDNMEKFNDKAILNKKNWGVKPIKAWKDKLPKEVVDRLRKMASKEREMRGF